MSKHKDRVKILIGDIIYERKSPSPLPVPFAIGKIATYAKKILANRVDIRLVRTIDQFYYAIENNRFDIVGLSHYMWNANLTRFLAQHLKIIQPDCVIIFGGPNLPIHIGKQERYIRSLPCVDFFIEKEGEIPFTNLVSVLIENNLDVEKIKTLRLKSVRCIKDGEFITSRIEDRPLDLDFIPSPYLEGLMDEFLEVGYVSIIENTRGCPFRCAYCGHADPYHAKVAKHSIDYLRQQYDYIAKKMHTLRHLPFSGIIYFTDSNTGMHPIHVDISQHLNRLQMTYEWPKQIIASTGKSQQERIVECIGLLNGALTMTASVQSTDLQVLKNIDRKNLSLDFLLKGARQRGEDKKSYSEIILGLPGDSYEKHLKSIRDIVDGHGRINEVKLNQLMILPDTLIASPEFLKQFKMKTKFRFIVKGFERVKVGESFKLATEYEEICIETENMSFGDYLKARMVGLIIHIFYNNVVSDETFEFFEKNNLSIFEYLKTIIEMEKPEPLVRIIDGYLKDVQNELFDSERDVKAFLEREGLYERLVEKKAGINPTYFYITKAKECIEDVITVAREAASVVGGPLLAEHIERDHREHNNWGLGIQRGYLNVGKDE